MESLNPFSMAITGDKGRQTKKEQRRRERVSTSSRCASLLASAQARDEVLLLADDTEVGNVTAVVSTSC